MEMPAACAGRARPFAAGAAAAMRPAQCSLLVSRRASRPSLMLLLPGHALSCLLLHVRMCGWQRVRCSSLAATMISRLVTLALQQAVVLLRPRQATLQQTFACRPPTHT